MFHYTSAGGGGDDSPTTGAGSRSQGHDADGRGKDAGCETSAHREGDERRAAGQKVRARRQRIPAFGEWNYDYGGAGDWPVTQYFDSAMQAGLVVAIPPPSPKPHKKAVKWSDSATLGELDDEKQRQPVVVGLGDQGAVTKQGKQSRVADASPAYKACRVAVKAVDQDLYHIPPDMLCLEPRKRPTRRTLWMGCLGLSCIAA